VRISSSDRLALENISSSSSRNSGGTREARALVGTREARALGGTRKARALGARAKNALGTFAGFNEHPLVNLFNSFN